MFNKNVVLLLVIPFTLSGCKKEETTTRKESELPVIVEPETEIDEIEEKDYKKIPSYIYSKMASFSSYKAVTSGQTISSSIIKVTQSIDATLIKSEYSYLKNESHSDLVNTVHEAYYHDSNVLYKDNDTSEFITSSLGDYLNIYGIYPFDVSLEGYLIDEESIKSVAKVSFIDSMYTFKIIFDEEKSTNNVKIQMKKFGNLDEYPVFSSIEVEVLCDKEFKLYSVNLHSKYKAKKFLTTSCEQNYTVNYSNFNEDIEVPNLEFAKTKI